MVLRHCSVGYENAQNALEKSKVLVRTKIRQNDSLQTRITGKIYDISYCFHFTGIKNFDNFSGLKFPGSDAERI